ncbi:MAG: Tn3 family transposase, partial [Flammeovirgaceae bacterium]
QNNDDDKSDSIGLSMLKKDPGRVSLQSIEHELERLHFLEKLSIPDDICSAIPTSIRTIYQQRVGVETSWHMREHPFRQCYAMLALYCMHRKQEIIDNLVELLIQTIHKIRVTAERRVIQILLKDITSVHGKVGLLFKMAETALEHPHDTVEHALYPVVGKDTLDALVKEYRAAGPAFKREIHRKVHLSYRNHYRRVLPVILKALSFHSNNTLHRPVIEALTYLQRTHGTKKRTLDKEDLPIKGIVPKDLMPSVVYYDDEGNRRINRVHYEICVLQALRDRLRCKEIWVVGAKRYCNPDHDVPQDFAERRDEYCQALQLPLSGDEL